MKKIIVFILILMLVAVGQNMAFAAKIESNSSPNYLIILVHGSNQTSRFFCGKDVGGQKGEEGSDLNEEPNTDVDFGDLKGYLENDLGLKGYVYS